MAYYVDLNSDIGERFGSYKMGMDEENFNNIIEELK